MNAAKQVAVAALELTEHLMRAHKREIVDPLIASTALVLATRFRRQRRALDSIMPDIESLLTADHRMAQALPSAVSAAVIGAFADFQFPLFDDHIEAVTGDAFDGGAEIAADQIGVTVPKIQKPFDELLSDEIDGTTRKGVMDAARGVFMGGLTFAALVDAVDAVFADAVDNRAEMIATTEIANAFNSGAAAVAIAARNKGVRVEKMWSAEPDACDICLENEAQEWIDADETFASGDDAPGAHPWCKCSLELRTAEDG